MDIENLEVRQCPSKGVETKNSKAQITYILKILDLLEIVYQWDNFIQAELGEDALWYPNLSRDGNNWVIGKSGKTESRRMAFSRGLKRMCKKAKSEYKSPHKIRHGYGVYGVQNANSIKEIEAISQNMGHESLDITLRYDAKQTGDEVKSLILGMSQDQLYKSDDKLIREFLAFKEWQERGKD